MADLSDLVDMVPFRPDAEANDSREDGDQAPARLPLIDPTKLAGLMIPSRRWLVADWIPWGVVTGLYGDGGVGKTLLAQQLQTAAALGKSWLGLDTTPVRSLGVYCEDDHDELWRRQASINRMYGCDFTDIEGVRWLPRLGTDNVLMSFGSGGQGTLTDFHAQVIQAALEHRAEAVIIDTVADTYGGNENDRAQARKYVATALGGIAQAIGGTVLCCAHPSRSGLSTGTGDSGSTGWSNSFRSRLFVSHVDTQDGDLPDQNARLLTRKKANYAARNDELKLRWFDGALVLDAGPDAAASSLFRPAVDRVFLDLLDATIAEDRPVSDNPRSGNFAPRLFEMRPDRQGYTKTQFARAMEMLFSTRAIALETYGRQHDQRR